MCIYSRLSGPFPPGATNLSGDAWFCPSHFCSGCGTLETSRKKIDVYPLEVIAAGAHSSGGVDLTHCSCCPFSLCFSCGVGMGGSRARGNSGGGTASGIFKNMHPHMLLANEIKLPQAASVLGASMKSGALKKVSLNLLT